MIGDLLGGRYRVERLLGRGGTSSVWLAHDQVLDRPVAVKLLHVRRMRSDDAVERFEREARTLAALAHPGIVTVIDRGEEAGRPFIVFEYVRGVDLRTRIDEDGRLEPALALGICVQVASALAYAHDHGVLHRDVKPHNVLLTPDGTAKLTDFGIARVDQAPSLTQTGRVLGTGAYVAPEQALGSALDERTDVYALGVMLYECLVGEQPYRGEGFVEVAEQHVHAPVPSACARRPELPAQVDRVLERALAKRPEDRYHSCRELARDLEAVRADVLREGVDDTDELTAVVAVAPQAPAAAAPLPPAAQVAAPAAQARGGRHRGSLALLVVVLVGGAAWIGYLASGVLGGESTTPVRTAPQTLPVGTSQLGGGSTTPAAAAPVAGLTATSFDPPPGDGQERNDLAAQAVDGNPATVWTTERYPSAGFGNKTGVGLVLKPPAPVAASALVLRVPATATGWSGRVYRAAGPALPPSLAGWQAASGSFAVSGPTTRITLARPTSSGLYMVWITSLAPADGRYGATIAEATLLAPRSAGATAQ